jgi:hypothetical protein
MDRQLTWKQANWHALQGKAARREAWRRWVLFDAFSHIYLEQLPASDTTPVTVRVARSISASGGTPDDSSFTIGKDDLDANDWTLLPWDSASPAPTVPPAYSPAGGTGGSSPAETPKGEDPPLILIIYPGITPGGGGGGRTVPHNPPVSTAVVTLSFETSLVPAGDACLLPDQYQSGPPTCTVWMTVNVAGGPAGVFGMSIALGAYTKPAVSAYDGYNDFFTFTGVPVNPGGSLTPAVVYHATGGDITAALPLFTFLPACPPRLSMTFFHGGSEDTSVATLVAGSDITLPGDWVYHPVGSTSFIFDYGIFGEQYWLLTDAEWDALTFTLNGGTPVSIADMPGADFGVLLDLEGPGAGGLFEAADGANVLVIGTLYFTATVRFNAVAGEMS